MVKDIEDLDYVERNLQTLVEGKTLINEDNKILYLKGVLLGELKDNIHQSGEYGMSEINDLEIYVNPMQQTLDEALDKIRSLQKEIDFLKLRDQ